jgi:two-component system, cell cycle sensor histidine kinase and response regulator CckA
MNVCCTEESPIMQNTPRYEELNDELLRLRQEVAELKNALDVERHKFDGCVQQAEASAKESGERFKRLVQNSNDIIAVIDEHGILLELSGPTENVIGFNSDELLGTSGFDRIHPDDREAARKALTEILRQPGSSGRAEYRYQHKDGSWVEMEAAGTNLQHDSSIKGIVLNSRDISERNRLQEQLQNAAKIEAIGVLAGGVAHDFNNLLSVINGYCELMLDDLWADDSRRHDVEQIHMAGKRAALLTSQLLAFSQKQIFQPVVLDLNNIIVGMKSMLRQQIRENIDLSIIPQPGLGLINADAGQIQQIVMNLAANARDAIPREGKLIIETADVKLDAEYVREHPTVQAGSYIMLAISDNGMGMNVATKAHLFEPFFTTKARGKGTGLGLSTVYGIVNQSNGFITVNSEPGEGSTFKIYFPRAEGEALNASCESKVDPGLGGLETVLIVEDESMVRSLAARVLSDRGYTVLVASNGAEALKIAREYDGKIHLLLTDVIMPGMSGKELASRLEAELPGIKTLFISGYTDNAIVRHGMLDSGVDFLQKPFTVDNLMQKIRAVLG